MLRQVLRVKFPHQVKRFCSTNHAKFNPNDDYYSQAYADEFTRSLTSPEDYWAENGEKYIKWMKKWDKVLDNSNPPCTKWYKGGLLNVCYNALDRHVEDGHGDRVALIHDSPITKSPVKHVTYSQLLEMVEKLAGVYGHLGVCKGDRVLIYMPMIPEAVAAMLASSRLGAVHSLVFGGFAPRELAVRINHAQPSLIVTVNAGFEPNKTVEYKKFVDQALEISGAPVKHVLVFDRPEAAKANLKAPRDVAWGEAMDKAIPHHCVPVEADHPLYILYTSGTSGDPKGIQRPSGGHAVALPWSMDKIFNIQPGETWWAASDLGWVVGHSYICYGPLLRRLTSIVYEGKPVGTPDAGQFFRVVQDHQVKSMMTSPTALRSIRREDFSAVEGRKYCTKSMSSLFVVGEHCDYETREWAQDKFRIPVLDHWWQTETGHAITATCLGLGQSSNPPRDVSGMALPGYDVRVLKENLQEAARGELGRIVIKLPLPPGCMSTLYKAEERFKSAYFNEYLGYYDTMDAGFIDQHGFVCVMARDDDVINVAGHRLSTSALEEAILEHPEVVDCAVVGVPDDLKGEVPLGLFVMAKGSAKDPQVVKKELVEIVRELVGPVAAFKLAAPVVALPRTRSGKTARKSIADFARDKQIKLPGTIEDPGVYKDIKRALNSLGFAKNAPEPQ